MNLLDKLRDSCLEYRILAWPVIALVAVLWIELSNPTSAESVELADAQVTAPPAAAARPEIRAPETAAGNGGRLYYPERRKRHGSLVASILDAFQHHDRDQPQDATAVER